MTVKSQAKPHTHLQSTYLRMILLRSLATFLLHSGQAEVASATAADVSLAFIHGTVAITSPVAGFLTCGIGHAVLVAQSENVVTPLRVY